MKSVAVIYWSSTGNTEAMANAMAEGLMAGINNQDIELKLTAVNQATIEDVRRGDVVAFGCPAMGVESLDNSEMAPFIDKIKGLISGKGIVLFGSFGWGDGEWMETWQEDMESYGAKLIGENLMINDTPDEAGLAKCRAFGKLMQNYVLR